MSTEPIHIYDDRAGKYVTKVRAPFAPAGDGVTDNVPMFRASRAVNRLRAWVNHEHDKRPARGELRHDVEALLDERLRLVTRVEELRLDARGERVKIQAEFTELCEELDRLRGERDELTGALDAQSLDTAEAKDRAGDVERYRALLRKAHTERDAWQAEAKLAHGKLDHLRDELKLALDEVERLVGALQRAKTSAAARPDHVRLTTTTTRMEFPRRVASSDNDV